MAIYNIIYIIYIWGGGGEKILYKVAIWFDTWIDKKIKKKKKKTIFYFSPEKREFKIKIIKKKKKENIKNKK